MIPMNEFDLCNTPDMVDLMPDPPTSKSVSISERVKTRSEISEAFKVQSTHTKPPAKPVRGDINRVFKVSGSEESHENVGIVPKRVPTNPSTRRRLKPRVRHYNRIKAHSKAVSSGRVTVSDGNVKKRLDVSSVANAKLVRSAPASSTRSSVSKGKNHAARMRRKITTNL